MHGCLQVRAIKESHAAEVGRLTEAMSAAVAAAAEKEKTAGRQQAALSKAKAALEEEKVRQ
jgi:hypothetical protein